MTETTEDLFSVYFEKIRKPIIRVCINFRKKGVVLRNIMAHDLIIFRADTEYPVFVYISEMARLIQVRQTILRVEFVTQIKKVGFITHSRRVN